MKKWEFVITGGPCAGKSTVINIIKEKLSNQGCKVITVPEPASELVFSGIYPWELETSIFQSILISRAFNKEKTIRKAAHYIKKDTIIIYDRGILDAKAYMEDYIFEKEIKKYNVSEKEILESYDGVFHLVTAANGAEEFYTLSNNNARKETLEQARALDNKTIEVWKNHKNLKIIDNSTNFEEKINRLLKAMELLIKK